MLASTGQSSLELKTVPRIVRESSTRIRLLLVVHNPLVDAPIKRFMDHDIILKA